MRSRADPIPLTMRDQGVDPLSRVERSERMRKVRSRGNRSTERAVAEAFRRAGIKGWRRHTICRGILTFCSGEKRLLCSCMGVSGTDAPGALDGCPVTTPHFGKPRSPRIARVTAELPGRSADAGSVY